MARPRYSFTFIHGELSAGTPSLTYTPPAGHFAVISWVSAVSSDGGSVIMTLPGVIFWASNVSGGAFARDSAFLHLVALETQQIAATRVGGTTSVTVSGYLLELP